MTYEQLIYSLFGAFSPFFMPDAQADNIPTLPTPTAISTPSATADTQSGTSTTSSSTVEKSNTTTGTDTSATSPTSTTSTTTTGTDTSATSPTSTTSATTGTDTSATSPTSTTSTTTTGTDTSATSPTSTTSATTGTDTSATSPTSTTGTTTTGTDTSATSPTSTTGTATTGTDTSATSPTNTTGTTTTGTDTSGASSTSTTGTTTTGTDTSGASSTSTTGTTTTGTDTSGASSTSTTATERPTVKTARRRTALELSRQYFDTRLKCDDGAPAYMCTGVMLRSNKDYSDQYHVWDPSPFSTRTGGTSFSWLRSDTRYSHLAFGYNSGFIFFPQQKAPENAIKINALCYFLLDASSASRDNHGCGASTVEFPNTSDTCDHYGIASAEKWIEHYLLEPNDRQHHQCGFDLTSDSAVAAERFKVATEAHAMLGETGFNELNEFRLGTWESGKGSQLPLQAFFYLANTDGLSDAQHYQLDYYNQTHAFLPVIKVTMPQTQDANVNFNYVPDDQSVTPVY